MPSKFTKTLKTNPKNFSNREGGGGARCAGPASAFGYMGSAYIYAFFNIAALNYKLEDQQTYQFSPCGANNLFENPFTRI